MKCPKIGSFAKELSKVFYFTIDLFVDALVLILHAHTEEVHDVIQRLLDAYEQEASSSTFVDDSRYRIYIYLIEEIMNTNINIRDDLAMDAYILKLKNNTFLAKDPESFTLLKKILTDKSEFTQDQCDYIIRKINNTLLWISNAHAVKMLYAKLSGTQGSTASPEKQDKVLDEISEICKDIVERTEARKLVEEDDENTANYVDFDNIETVEKAFTVYKNTNVVNLQKTGLQGLNRMLGGGFPLGSSIVFNALSSNCKSTMMMKMVRWQLTLNKISESYRNPICLFYSLENRTPENLMILFKDLYCNTYHEVPPDELPINEIVHFLCTEFKKYGWRFVMEYRPANSFGFMDFVTSFESYVSAGYTPLMVCVDYLSKCNMSGRNDNVGNHILLRELYSNMCSYTKARSCTFVTGHQLNRKAQEVARQCSVGCVKRFGIDMLADGLDPQREVDIAFYQHKDYDATGRAFLSFAFGKNRYQQNIPEKYKYCAYMFNGPLGILDDINGEDQSTDNIYKVKHAEVDPRSEENKEIELAKQSTEAGSSLLQFNTTPVEL